MEKAPERIRKIKPFIVKQTGIIEKRINFLSEKDDSKTFEEKKIKILMCYTLKIGHMSCLRLKT